MTQEEKELLLIQLIMVNGSISSLIEAGLTFVDIHKLIQQYKRAKYIVSDNGKLQITEEGKVKFNELCRYLNKRGLYKYISPNLKYRIKPMDLEEIYVPLCIRKE